MFITSSDGCRMFPAWGKMEGFKKFQRAIAGQPFDIVVTCMILMNAGTLLIEVGPARLARYVCMHVCLHTHMWTCACMHVCTCIHTCKRA